MFPYSLLLFPCVQEFLCGSRRPRRPVVYLVPVILNPPPLRYQPEPYRYLGRLPRVNESLDRMTTHCDRAIEHSKHAVELCDEMTGSISEMKNLLNDTRRDIDALFGKIKELLQETQLSLPFPKGGS